MRTVELHSPYQQPYFLDHTPDDVAVLGTRTLFLKPYFTDASYHCQRRAKFVRRIGCKTAELLEGLFKTSQRIVEYARELPEFVIAIVRQSRVQLFRRDFLLTSAALFAVLRQKKRPRPWLLKRRNSLQKYVGVDPLVDSQGQSMHWARRLEVGVRARILFPNPKLPPTQAFLPPVGVTQMPFPLTHNRAKPA